MPLNKVKGNMYPWVDYTLTIYRRCDHECVYCYRKSMPGHEKWTEVAEQDFNLNLQNKGTIFVANTGDLFGMWVDPGIISRVLQLCRKYPENWYLFQSKNPTRFKNFFMAFPPHTILGTTIETTDDIYERYSIAPPPYLRAAEITHYRSMKTMVSIEPIMDFDLQEMISWMQTIRPTFISIGADSKKHNLPEPPAAKIKALISELQKFTDVKIKPNLWRLMK